MTNLKDIKMPELDEGVTEATVVEWLLEVDATFAKGDVLLEIMTDKVSMDVVAQEDGTLVSILVGDDQEVLVDTVLGQYKPAA